MTDQTTEPMTDDELTEMRELLGIATARTVDVKRLLDEVDRLRSENAGLKREAHYGYEVAMRMRGIPDAQDYQDALEELQEAKGERDGWKAGALRLEHQNNTLTHRLDEVLALHASPFCETCNVEAPTWREVKLAARRAGYRVTKHFAIPKFRFEKWLITKPGAPWHVVVSCSGENGWHVGLHGPDATVELAHIDDDPGRVLEGAGLAGMGSGDADD